MSSQKPISIRIVCTGGTISKTYCETEETLKNRQPIVEAIIAGLRLPDVTFTYDHLLSKDSRDLTAADRSLIVETVRQAAAGHHAVIVLHGTDTLQVTGEMLCRELQGLSVPVILTGAMRPYEFRDSDALQNVTESLLAARFVDAGVYVVMHNKVLRFPGVVKDWESRTFRQK